MTLVIGEQRPRRGWAKEEVARTEVAGRGDGDVQWV